MLISSIETFSGSDSASNFIASNNEHMEKSFEHTEKSFEHIEKSFEHIEIYCLSFKFIE